MLSGVSSLVVKAGVGTRRLESAELPEKTFLSRKKRSGSVELEDATKVRNKFMLHYQFYHSALCTSSTWKFNECDTAESVLVHMIP